MFLKENNVGKDTDQMNKYEIGEVVVCINDKRRWYSLGALKKNEMYTISGFNKIDGGLILKEIKSPNSGSHAYAANRFRKVDASFFDEVYSSLMTELKASILSLNKIQYN